MALVLGCLLLDGSQGGSQALVVGLGGGGGGGVEEKGRERERVMVRSCTQCAKYKA